MKAGNVSMPIETKKPEKDSITLDLQLFYEMLGSYIQVEAAEAFSGIKMSYEPQ